MDYFAYPQYASGPKSPVVTGSMVANEDLVLVCLHAVARQDDGTMQMQTACGQPAYFNPEETGKPWGEINLTSKCRACLVKVDGVPVSGLTGRPVMP